MIESSSICCHHDVPVFQGTVDAIVVAGYLMDTYAHLKIVTV